MGKKTTPTGRAILLNKETKSKKNSDKKIKMFLEEFLRTSDQKKIVSPPTDFEKALIADEPKPIKIKTPKKIILPDFIDKTPKSKPTISRKRKK